MKEKISEEEILRIVSPFHSVISANLEADRILRGVGMMKQFMIATFADLILRVVLAFSPATDTLGSHRTWPADWETAMELSICFCRKKYGKSTPRNGFSPEGKPLKFWHNDTPDTGL